jgi:taurine-pyruvate aminotransferase
MYLLLAVYRFPSGQTQGSCSIECAKIYEEVINWEGAETISGVILEPVIIGGGIPPPEYLSMVRYICDKNGHGYRR